jgi:hypothetical protein
MDMATPVHQQRLFFTSGRRHGAGLDAIDGLELQPALLAPYRDPTRLRYDFPLILVDGATGPSVRALSSLIDEVLRELAPRGADGERLRRHVLRLEREIRSMVAAGERLRFSEAWLKAAQKLAEPDDPSVEQVLAHIAGKLGVDGEVVDCDASMPSRLVRHVWQARRHAKARAFNAIADRLIVRLSDILRAALLRSAAGQRPDALRAALGGSHRELFDFDAMSRLVNRTAPKQDLPPARRARIDLALHTLRTQRFYSSAQRSESAEPLEFCFDNCADASKAFRERLKELADVVKAIAIAELEADGRYVEATHDAFFEQFDVASLTADDLALFPDYLVAIPEARNEADENARLLDLLSAGMPLKVLVETHDPIEAAAPGDDRFAFGVRSMRLANTATGLGGVFVLQAAASHLPALQDGLERGMAHDGAVLLSVYSADEQSSTLPAYLVGAAAMESRAFPAFVYDPKAGDNQAARFSLRANPQPEADFPESTLEYADEKEQRVTEATAFTIADFALCDRRYAAHFVRVPRSQWNDALIPMHEWLARDTSAQADVIPYVLAVDEHDVLQRVIVDARLTRLVLRGRTFWRRLQEQGGIHNSHAALAVAREKAKWEAEHTRAPEASSAAQAAVAEPAPAAKAPAAEAPAAAPGHTSDDPWIETPRCPSCNECQTINDRMFKYNENKQAYIADVNAGTYRQLVEAAEVCQVAIIHPGKPRNPNEPGLDELLERAKPFLA